MSNLQNLAQLILKLSYKEMLQLADDLQGTYSARDTATKLLEWAEKQPEPKVVKFTVPISTFGYGEYLKEDDHDQ